MGIKKISILGSTGSIGLSTLKIVERHPDKFQVFGLTAYNNFELLLKQIKQFSPKFVAVNPGGIEYLKQRIKGKTLKVLDIESEIEPLVTEADIDIIVLGIKGVAALNPFLKAIAAGKTIAPANKEALVIAGDIIMAQAKKFKANIIPVDSEQSAIFQCLQGQKGNKIKRIYLTASGGPLLNLPKSQFGKLTVDRILAHPRWKMGKKITVDSATLMNKGFELIETQRLFGVQSHQVQILVHPEAIIHSMVEFEDGSILAQLGITDMQLPIQYALSYPNRIKSGLEEIDFYNLKQLTFQRPDFKKFPSLELAFYVAQKGGTLPCVLNAADEEAVEAFLKGNLDFLRIYKVVEKVTLAHKITHNPNLAEILAVDQWAREKAKEIISRMN